MLGFAGCNDDENKDNIPPTLREYEAPVFMYGKTREEVKASVPYAYSGASETSLYFEGKGIVKEYIYIFEDDKYGHEIEMYTVEQGEKRDKRQ